MYEAHYGLREKPFSILPDPDLIFWAPNHRLAFAMLEFGVLNSAGFTVITGDIGCGKTTLVRRLLRHLDPKVVVGLISNTPKSEDGLLRWVMMSLNQPFEGSNLELFQRFQRFLYEQESRRRRVILIVDEAQNLSVEALEELRMLSNINADKKQFLQMILVGQPQLKDLLRSPRLVQFTQRISSDFHLKPLNADEVTGYIDYRLEAVGASELLFSDQACKRVAEASQGVPRTINVLCDTALVYGYAADAQYVTMDIVNAVIEGKAQYGVLPLSAASG
jgi:general secretion pathway protein A